MVPTYHADRSVKATAVWPSGATSRARRAAASVPTTRRRALRSLGISARQRTRAIIGGARCCMAYRGIIFYLRINVAATSSAAHRGAAVNKPRRRGEAAALNSLGGNLWRNIDGTRHLACVRGAAAGDDIAARARRMARHQRRHAHKQRSGAGICGVTAIASCIVNNAHIALTTTSRGTRIKRHIMGMSRHLNIKRAQWRA